MSFRRARYCFVQTFFNNLLSSFSEQPQGQALRVFATGCLHYICLFWNGWMKHAPLSS
jgi:hypothetical protein